MLPNCIMNKNTTSDSSKKQVRFQENTLSNRKPRHTKSQRYRDKMKKDKSSVAIAQVKEDSHKKHPKMDHVSSSIECKLKEFETLCLPQRDLLLQSRKSILKSKKKVTSHHDTLNKLKHTSFNSKSIVKNISMTASKSTMDSQAFKMIPDRNKAKQLSHMQENKDDVIEVKELDYQAMVNSLIET